MLASAHLHQLGLVIGMLFAMASGNVVKADDVRFNRDIRPILSDKCFACHGPDASKAEADLRLDLADNVAQSGAIVPRDAESSEVMERILATDPDLVMPPPETHKTLNQRERELIRKWINEGAEYESHWAYQPMRAASSKSDENIVDHFVSSRLDREGVEPTKRADRITLIRRLSFDLTGLPPTRNEVDAFLADRSDNAYANLVRRLLDSPRYGERMAAYWLDLVRYADTVGYHGDQEVSQWAYRDYVINSFNANRPYDEFIREQLAGDLMPDASTEQLIASGYNRLNQTTEEGGSQAKEYLAIYFADRVRNVSQVFLGSTLGCAQCHDHKYDPFSTKDFYSFGAFFADIEERGVYGGRGSRPPVLPLPTEEQKQRLAELKAELTLAEKRRTEVRAELLGKLADWIPPERVERAWIDEHQPASRKYSGAWNFETADTAPGVVRGTRSRQQSSDGLVQHYFNEVKEPVTVSAGTRFYVWVRLDAENPPAAIMLQLNDGKSWEHRAVWGSDDIGYGKRPESWAGYQRMGELPAAGEWVRLEVPAEKLGLKPGDKATGSVSGMAFTQFGGQAWWDEAGSVQALPDDVATAWKVAASERTAEQNKSIEDFYLAAASELTNATAEVANLKGEIASVESMIPTTVVSRAVTPREIRILPRGNWMDDSGPVVQPAIPEFLGKLETGDKRATRLDLANWIASSENPLTARTIVNRVWSLLFGRGICSSLDDFGGQGVYPSDPDLLDALAVEFVESGWDIKHLIRLIVSSDAYQRSSLPTEQLLERDVYNDLFARQGRFRVDAEVVRDTALSIGGLLVERQGGSSSRPYQPAGYYAHLNFPSRTYKPDTDENQYRRAVYTHWQRTYLHPMLKAFDAPSREECTAQRARSNTPLQALTLLNDPTFVEAARSFAERIIREGGQTTKERLVWAYREAVSHEPEANIVNELKTLYDQQASFYEENGPAAVALINVGFSTPNTGIDSGELAAWTNIARVLLNLHETTTRY